MIFVASAACVAPAWSSAQAPATVAGTGKSFKVAGALPSKLGVNYNVRRKSGDVVNGEPGDPAKLEIEPLLPAGTPLRITLELTFPYDKYGLLTIPRTTRLRLLFEKGKYSPSGEDLKTIARDFITVMNEVGDFTNRPISNADVTITIHDDAGNKLDTLEGGLQIVPRLVNSRD